MNLQSGAFGDPQQLKTLILFWTKMELLHYPGAGETRTYLEEELRTQEMQAQMQAAQQQMQMRGQQQAQGGGEEAAAVIERARRDAQAAAQSRQTAPDGRPSGRV